jgi:hypothetical protein
LRKGGKKEEEKHESLKALEDYSSSSEEEEEEEKTLEKETFRLQGKRIDSEEVAEYIKKQFEESVFIL